MLVLLVNVAAVLFMASFIWTMQIVHYPLFGLWMVWQTTS